MTIPAKCMSTVSVSHIKVSENGRSFELVNLKKDPVEVIKVDGCAIVIGERCDFAYFLNSGKEIFVELKGSDIKKALSQLIATIPKITIAASKDSRASVIVSSRVPKEDTSTQIAKRKLLKDLVSRVYIKNTSVSVDESFIFS